MKFFSSPDFKPVSKQMFHIAIPIAISGLVLQVQSLIDTAFLARYSTSLPDGALLSGSEILSAVGNVFFPYLVALSFIWSISTGVVILVSQRLGANEPASARRYAATAIKFNTLLSWLVYLFWFFFAKQVFTLMGVHQPILTLSLDYMRFLSLELLYLGLSTSIGAVFQGAGNTRPEMIAGILRSLLHICLDYLFIFGNFGLPEMGVAGAGMASSLSGLVACLGLLSVLLTSKNLPFKINLKTVFWAPMRDYWTVLKVGLPVGVEDMLWNLGNLVLAYFLNLLNAEAVGIYRLVYQIEITPIYFYSGLARSVTTLVGNRTGERNLPGAQEVARIGSFYTASFCLLFTTAFFVLPKQIISIFTSDSHLIEKAAPLLVITAFTMIPRAINIISGHAIRGYGDTLWMLATQVFGILFIISFSYLLMFPLGLGMYGLFIGMFSDETIRGIINTVRFYRGETSIFHKAPVVENEPVSLEVA
ncbi:MAG: MATE family efflux transporter [Anaerolineae bacterium]|nr:MATE family efflux transporter [Anaerolineae bacterium]